MGGTIVVFGLGLACLLFAIIYFRRASRRYATATQLWNRGEATILDCSYRKTVQRTANGSVTSYQPLVRYSYGAAGEREGTRPFLNARTNLGSQAAADAWVARFPPGSRVPVWSDPADPDDAALELNKPTTSVVIVFGLLGVALLVLGAYMAYRLSSGH